MTVTLKRVSLGLAVVVIGYGVYRLLKSEPVRVETAPVAWRPIQVTVDEEGETRVRDRFVVFAPVSGRVSRITVREGDSVRAGAPLARMFPAPLDARTRAEAAARLAAAEDAQRASAASVAQARAAHDQAVRERQRAGQLAGQNAIAAEDRERTDLQVVVSARNVESAEFRAQAAEHEVEVARAALAADGVPIAIRAPVKGKILRVPEPSERVVAAGTPLVEIGDPARLEIVADLLSADAVQVAPGSAVLIEGWGGQTLRGRVRRVEPSAFTKVSALGVDEQRVNVIVDLPEWPAALGDRYRVEIRIVTWSADRVLSVPTSALFRAGDAWRLFVLEGGRARQREVTVGHRTTLDAEIVRGVREGEMVIRYPSDRVSDGVAVVEDRR